MSDENWKQSAVMFYAAGTIITIISFLLCILYHVGKNREKRRNIQKYCCWCCINDPMVAYDSVNRNEDSPTEEDELLNDTKYTIEDDEEIEINIHGEIELNNKNNNNTPI